MFIQPSCTKIFLYYLKISFSLVRTITYIKKSSYQDQENQSMKYVSNIARYLDIDPGLSKGKKKKWWQHKLTSHPLLILFPCLEKYNTWVAIHELANS